MSVEMEHNLEKRIATATKMTFIVNGEAVHEVSYEGLLILEEGSTIRIGRDNHHYPVPPGNYRVKKGDNDTMMLRTDYLKKDTLDRFYVLEKV